MSQSESEKRFRTQAEAAKDAGVDVRTIQRWVSKGLLPKGKGCLTKKDVDFAKSVQPYYQRGITFMEIRDFLEEVSKAIQILSDTKERIESKIALLVSATGTGQEP